MSLEGKQVTPIPHTATPSMVRLAEKLEEIQGAAFTTTLFHMPPSLTLLARSICLSSSIQQQCINDYEYLLVRPYD